MHSSWTQHNPTQITTTATMYDQLLKDPSLPVPNPTTSHWQSPAHVPLLNLQSSTLPPHRDTIIIGSGITSCALTHSLLTTPKTPTSPYPGTITVLEARQVCSGATGRNGGRINCLAVFDFDKYTRLFGVEAAAKIVRFELAHHDEIYKVARELGDEGFERSEVRKVEAVLSVFSEEKLEEVRGMLGRLEAALPELKGRWRVVGEDGREVRVSRS